MTTEVVEDVLTISEAAAFLRVGPKAIRRLCRLRKLPHRIVDRKGTIRLSRQAIEEWLRMGGAK